MISPVTSLKDISVLHPNMYCKKGVLRKQGTHQTNEKGDWVLSGLLISNTVICNVVWDL